MRAEQALVAVCTVYNTGGSRYFAACQMTDSNDHGDDDGDDDDDNNKRTCINRGYLFLFDSDLHGLRFACGNDFLVAVFG